jgi:group I intron endonuclease
MSKPAGIYVISDNTAGKAYVDSSGNLPIRLKQHLRNLESRKHGNWKLQKAFCDGNDLQVTVIPMKDGEDILACEQKLLDSFYDSGTLYNIAKDAVAPNKGMVVSQETREKQRQATLGFRHSPETIARLCEIAKVHGVPRATIEAGAAARLGKKLSAEHIEIVRQTSKERMTPEAREHLRKVNLGTKHTHKRTLKE